MRARSAGRHDRVLSVRYNTWVLPFSTSRRNLALLVSAFVDALAEHIREDAPKTVWPSDPDDPCADIQLEEFVGRLQGDVDQLQMDYLVMAYGEDTEASAVESMNESLRELFQLVPWQRSSTSLN